jgi:hypothetical protein
LDLIGLATRIVFATTNIDYGRKAYAIRGKAEESRLSYEDGIAQALTVFQEAQASADPRTIILAEYTFLSQELQLCPETDKGALVSLTKAVQAFDDAFLALKVVEEKTLYYISESLIPHHEAYRYHGFPMDSFLVACKSHITRLNNFLRTPGIDPIEKTLLKQRLANLTTAQNSYVELQKKAMTKEEK